MPRENKTRYALLGMLTYSPMSGYDMKKVSDHSIGHFWNENYGNIYPVLRKMEAEGLVTMIREDQEGAPAKKVYTITEAGREELVSWLRRPAGHMILRDELLLQVFFGQWTDPEVILGKIKAEDSRCAGIIAVLEGIRAHMKSGEPVDGVDGGDMEKIASIKNAGIPFWRSTVEFGLRYYSGIRDWCAETIKRLESLQNE